LNLTCSANKIQFTFPEKRKQNGQGKGYTEAFE